MLLEFRWQFMTDSSDIGFGVTYKVILDNGDSKVKEEVVVPSGRLNSHMVPEDGSVTCENPGLCESKLISILKLL